MKDKQLVKNVVSHAITAIRMYVKDQVDLWRKIPRLAFLADGLDGYSGQYRRAFERKEWIVSEDGGMGPYVQLATGELIGRDKDIIAFDIDCLDAASLVNRLIMEGKVKPSKFIAGRSKNDVDDILYDIGEWEDKLKDVKIEKYAF